MNPLVERYASKEMAEIFSRERRYRLWRMLWISLAKAQKKLGFPIRAEQIREMEMALDRIDPRSAAAWEKRTRHEVVAQIRHFARQAPSAGPILHLGATSAYVMDNADLIQMRDGLRRVRSLLVAVLHALRGFAWKYRSLPQVAYTHFQPAQLTTVGKRACLWVQDLLLDLRELDATLGELRFLGSKGAVGTQASFLDLFEGDHGKVRRLDELVARDFGFERVFEATGQTYPRKVDVKVLSALAAAGCSAHRFGTDLRLLQHLGEVTEPFGEEQVGSSAMPYKRNPVQAERLCSLSRLLEGYRQAVAWTAASQWLERTLDDSAARRVAVPEAFLAADAVLGLYLNLARGLKVHRDAIAASVSRHMPFLVSERLLVEGVRMGGDRQELHEKIRRASREGAAGLLERLTADGRLGRVIRSGKVTRNPGDYVGRAPQQVEEFLRREVDPVLRKERKWRSVRFSVRV